MPDGLTHILIGYIGIPIKSNKEKLAFFFIGCLLPDIFLRGCRILFIWSAKVEWIELYFMPIHTPIGATLISLAISQFFHHNIRKMAFYYIWIGTITHFILDFCQLTIYGRGLKSITINGYHWFYPFCWYDYQFGLLWPEEIFLLLIIIIPISCLIFIKRRNNI